MRADAVFEGGGVKAIALAGAVTAMEEEGYRWNRVAGTSAGAIAAALLAVGFTGKELSNILMSMNYENLLLGGSKGIGVAKKVINLIGHNGIYSTSNIEIWLDKLLQTKGKSKFKDISENGQSKLKIVATDISRRKIIILPDDLEEYGINPIEFKISKAVAMSISIPFFFIPLTLGTDKDKGVIVDGGLLSNFPVWIFDVNYKPRWPTFGFRLWENKKSRSYLGKNDIISYALDIVSTALDKNEEVYLADKDQVRTMNIPTLGISSVQFDISKKQAAELYKSGYNTAKDFVSEWDFQRYIGRYRT